MEMNERVISDFDLKWNDAYLYHEASMLVTTAGNNIDMSPRIGFEIIFFQSETI